MKTIPITAIQISPERQRQEFDSSYINELRESIEAEGLFNAVVLRDVGPFGGKQLVQGECRVRAITDLWALGGELRYDGQVVPAGQMPYTDLGDLDPLAAELAELHENSHRRSLSWQENMDATARIQRLREAIALRDGLVPPTVADISFEVRKSKEGVHHENTRREILLSSLAAKDPELKEAKSLDEAWKLAKRKEEKRKNVERAEVVGRTFTADSHSLHHADATIWLADCPEGKFDVILTDPIYGMGADEFGDSGVAGRRLGIAEHGYEDTYEAWLEMLAIFAPQSIRITKPQAHLYAFCDLDHYCEFRGTLQVAGWWVHRTPLIWHKPNALRVPWPEHGPRRSYELILYAVKGKKPVTLIGSDVITCAQEPNMGHMAQKPVALYKELLRRSIRPGDQILDPFAGTGPLIPAAHEMKCIATCVEKDANSYGLMLKRAEALKGQMDIEELVK